MRISPADKPLTPFELARIDAHCAELANFDRIAPAAKIEVLKRLAKDTVRLYAEVLRFNELDEMQAARDRTARPLTEAELEAIESGENGDGWENIRRLVAEVRRFYGSHTCGQPFQQTVEERDRLKALLEAADKKQFSSDVELENLRKILNDQTAEALDWRRKAEHNSEVAIQNQKSLDDVEKRWGEAVRTSNLVAAERDAALDRASVCEHQAVEAVKERKALERIVAAFRLRWPLIVADLEAPEPTAAPPAPMCRLDPLDDVFPPASAEGRPT